MTGQRRDGRRASMSQEGTAWDVRLLPDRSGHTYLVTGGNAGIGYFISEQLATTGAKILIGSRSAERAQLAIEAIRQRTRTANLEHVPLDLSKLDSVAGITNRLGALPRLDAVVLNAGVLAQQQRSTTGDGHELVFGTNHLGHFALVEHLLPLLDRTPNSRVVTMGSVAARFTRLVLTDLQSMNEPYRPMRTYARSKLAQTVFALDLDRRLRAVDSHIRSVVAHPGGALDRLTPSRPPVQLRRPGDQLKSLPYRAVAQSKEHAAWPPVRATVDLSIVGGELWGPRLWYSIGKPARETVPATWLDTDLAAELWEQSQQLTATTWSALGAPDRPRS